MAITAAQVKELRERTGLGMMECKKSLVENNGDIEKSIDALRKSGQAKAAKKSGRIAAEGLVCIKLAEDRSKAIILEINCETDFVARDENFLSFTQEILQVAFESSVANVADLMNPELEAKRQALIQKIGENVSVRRIEALEAKAESTLSSYVHNNNRIAVVVDINGGDAELGKNLAMHIAAFNPMVMNAEQVPEAIIAKEREIFMAQANDSGKPADVIEKMVAGRIGKFLKEVSLMNQAYVINPDISVGDLLKQANASMNSFARFEVGEGIEKETVDFAAEVMAQTQSSN